MDVLSLVRGPNALRRWAVASLVMNSLIVVTGALVRLTGSGLGCPTWPRCTTDSYVSHPALGIHGAIEFGNRLLTFVLIIIALCTLVSALFRRRHRLLAGGMAFGVPFQGVIGGITVLTGLNPYVVALHLMLSLVLIALSVWLVRRTRSLVPVPATGLGLIAVRVAFVGMWVAVWIGTVVTGSGPHAGDDDAPRNGLDGLLVTHVHAYAVYATIAATLVAVVVIRNRASFLLLGVELVQAGIGITQYRLGLPIGLVLLHLLGACLAIAAATNLHLSVRRLRPAVTARPRESAEPAVRTPVS